MVAALLGISCAVSLIPTQGLYAQPSEPVGARQALVSTATPISTTLSVEATPPSGSPTDAPVSPTATTVPVTSATIVANVSPTPLNASPTANGQTTATALPATADTTSVPVPTAVASTTPDVGPLCSSPAVVPGDCHEVATLRTRASNTYVGRNGVYTVHQSFGSVNYQDGAGTWQHISNTLVPATPALAAAGFAYQNEANSYQAAFAASGSGANLVQLTHNGATLGFTLLGGGASSGVVSGNTVTYANVFPQTNAVYNVENDQLKETLWLHDATAPSSFTFMVQANGVTPDMISSLPRAATARFFDAAGQQQFTMAPFQASDALGAVTPVSFTLMPLAAPPVGALGTHISVGGAGSAGAAFQVQASIPQSWLSDPARVWPIALDPTIVLN